MKSAVILILMTLMANQVSSSAAVRDITEPEENASHMSDLNESISMKATSQLSSPMQTNTWTNMNPTSKPSGIAEHAMAYDSQSDKIILFGGRNTLPSLGDTWAYDYNTNTWTNMSPTNKPSGREFPAMAYDSQGDRMILFGGLYGSPVGDTWAYDYNNNTWTDMNSANGPSARYSHAMVYDSQNDRIILFGGAKSLNSFSDDTWSYNYNTNTWTNMSPMTKPTALAWHAMAYDSRSDRTILFSGKPDGPALDETWAFDFNNDTWTNLNPSTKPYGRFGHAMAYNARSDCTILFGGYNGSWYDDTWSYDFNRNSWTNMNPISKPAMRQAHAITYDSQSNKVILFGGIDGSSYFNDTWSYYLIEGPLDHFEFDTISGPKIAGTGFSIMITAKDSSGNTVTTYSSTASLSDTTKTITPTSTGAFTGGIWTGNVKMTKAQTGVTITATGGGKTGTSNSFDVLPGSLSNIGILPSSLIIETGKTQQFAAKGSDAYGNEVTINPTWAANGGGTISSTGLFTAQAIGNWTAYANQSGMSGTASIEVVSSGIIPPTVVSTSPSNGTTNVNITTNIIIQFSEVMNKQATEGAIHSNPAVTGSFTWDGSGMTVTWDLSTNLAKNTKYTMTVDTGAKSADGVPMAESYPFYFTTEGGQPPTPPKVIATNPNNNSVDVPINAKISITFDKAMDQTSTEGSITITPSISFTPAWSSGDTVLILITASNLAPNTQYTVTIHTTARSTDGANLAALYSFSFKTGTSPDTTPPAVLRTSPENGARDVDSSSKIVITFNEAMDPRTEDAVSISPGSITKKEWNQNGDQLTLTVPLVDGVEYKVSISTTAKDLAGNSLPSTYVFSFTTKKPSLSSSSMISIIIPLLIIIIIITVIMAILIKRRAAAKSKETEAAAPPPSEKIDAKAPSQSEIEVKTAVESAKTEPSETIPLTAMIPEQKGVAEPVPKTGFIHRCEKCGGAYVEGGKCPYCK